MLTVWPIGVVILVCIFSAPAFSNEPIPAASVDGGQKQGHSSETDKKSANDQSISNQSPPIIKEINTPGADSHSGQDSHSGYNEPPEDRTLDLVSLIVTAFATVIIAIFTVAMACSTKRLWLEAKKASRISLRAAIAAKTSADAVMLSERAYIKMSHCPPGIEFSDPPGLCSVQIEVRNLGNTPARITQIIVNHIILSATELLPREPKYHPPERADEMFLYRDDPFYTTKSFTLANSDREAMQSGSKIFYIYGRIDYIDRFGQAHQSGYARKFARDINERRKNNLMFVTQPGYNYDNPYKYGK